MSLTPLVPDRFLFLIDGAWQFVGYYGGPTVSQVYFPMKDSPEYQSIKDATKLVPELFK